MRAEGNARLLKRMGFRTWAEFTQAMHHCNCALIGWPTHGKDARDCDRPGTEDYDWLDERDVAQIQPPEEDRPASGTHIL